MLPNDWQHGQRYDARCWQAATIGSMVNAAEHSDAPPLA